MGVPIKVTTGWAYRRNKMATKHKNQLIGADESFQRTLQINAIGGNTKSILGIFPSPLYKATYG